MGNTQELFYDNSKIAQFYLVCHREKTYIKFNLSSQYYKLLKVLVSSKWEYVSETIENEYKLVTTLKEFSGIDD